MPVQTVDIPAVVMSGDAAFASRMAGILTGSFTDISVLGSPADLLCMRAEDRAETGLVLMDASSLDDVRSVRDGVPPRCMLIVFVHSCAGWAAGASAAGADCVLPASASPAAVITSIQTLERTRGMLGGIICCGDLLLDPSSGRLTAGCRQDIALHGEDLRVMRCLMSSGGAWVTGQDLRCRFWGDSSRDMAAVQATVSRLQQILTEAGSETELETALQGVRLACEPSVLPF